MKPSRKTFDLTKDFGALQLIHQRFTREMPQKKIPVHAHADHEVFLPLTGTIEITLDTAEQPVLKAQPGQMIYLPAKAPHAFRASPEALGERFIFLVSEKFWKTCGLRSYAPQKLIVGQLFKELLFYLVSNPSSRSQKELLQTVVKVLGDLLEGQREERVLIQTSDPRIQRAQELLTQDLSQRPALSAIAKQSGLSVRNFTRLFEKETGRSPIQWLTQKRIQEAKRLLSQKSHTVTDVALAVGYQSLSQFIHTFRNQVGKLPSDF